MDEGPELENLSELISRAQAGEEEAVRSLRDLEQQIRLMVRARLPQELRSQFDSMDFVQDVWRSFMRILRDDPARFHDVQYMRRFLSGVARNKVFEEHRRRTQTHKYELSKQEPLYIRRGGRDVPREVPSDAPSPSEDLMIADEFDRLVAGRDPRAGQVLALRRQGLTYKEIGTKLGLSDRTVRRLVERVLPEE